MSRTRTAMLAALALVAGTAGAAAAAIPPDAGAAAVPCTVDYKVQNQWDTGFTAAVTVTNNGAAKSSWAVKWSYAGNQKVTSGWNAKISQSGTAVTAANESYNGTLATGEFGQLRLQGHLQRHQRAPDHLHPRRRDLQRRRRLAAAPRTRRTRRPPGAKVDNPYAGAKVYVNPEWSANAAAEPGGSRIANQPTGVWLDRTAAINGVNGGMGLRDHLDAALTQKGSDELVVQLVIYNLPGRDCSALASNGELGPTEIDKYKTQYIDPIVAILADRKYAGLRIVNDRRARLAAEPRHQRHTAAHRHSRTATR